MGAFPMAISSIRAAGITRLVLLMMNASLTVFSSQLDRLVFFQ